jgi:hypothetical protein
VIRSLFFSRCEKNRQNDVVKKTAETKLYLLGAMISPTPTTLVVTPSSNSSMQTFEGQLNKFTNVVKGWQYRWFVLSGETGNLDYYLMDEGNHFLYSFYICLYFCYEREFICMKTVIDQIS